MTNPRKSMALPTLILLALNCAAGSVAASTAESSDEILAAAKGKAPRGNLTARIMDPAGQPLSDIFLSLLNKDSEGRLLPILVRTNSAGLVVLKGIAAGTYEVLVRSAKFRELQANQVEVLAGRTSLATVVLQQVLGFEVPTEENLGMKALFRSASRRAVLRHQPGSMGDDLSELFSPYGRAVLTLTSVPDLGGDYLSFPSGSAGAAVTSFAVESPFGFNGSSILAGQIGSGEDSLWRLKNFLRHHLSSRHEIQVFLGYGRLSSAHGDPNSRYAPAQQSHADSLLEHSRELASVRTLSIGVEDRWTLSPKLSFSWGAEFNQVRAGQSQSFASPHAQVAYSPFEGSRLTMSSAAKRSSYGNQLELPSGEAVNLSDSFYVSKVDDEFRLGRARYNQVAFSQSLGSQGQVEAAAFSGSYQGAVHPFALRRSGQSEVTPLFLDSDQNDTVGWRVTYERPLSENLKAVVTYIRGKAVAIDSSQPLQSLEADELRDALERRDHHALTARFEAFVPSTKTSITALVSIVPGENPLPTLDPISDAYRTSNESLNLFVRQILPSPESLFSFLGIGFLVPNEIEALIDIRNLTNADSGIFHSEVGEMVLLQSPRSVRGGISVRF